VRPLVVALLAAGLALGLGAEWAAYEPGDLDRAGADLVTGWAFLICGALAARRPRGRPAGLLMALTGVAWFAGTLAPGALLYLHRGPLVHLLLAYPGARLARRPAQAVVTAAYFDGAVQPLGASAVLTVGLCAATAVVAVAEYARETGPRRRARAAPTAGALAVAAVLALTALAEGGESLLLAAYEVILVAVAVGLLVDLERGRWSVGAVTGLVVDLGELWEPVTLRDRLARALGDPSLQLGYRVGDRYADEQGRSFEVPEPGGERAMTPVDVDGERVALLVHDRTVLDDPQLVEAVASATRLAVTNVRLQAEVLARADQLAASRRRIVEAADAQRRRLQQELSEGAERRLAFVAAQVEALGPDVGDGRAGELLTDVKRQLAAAREELRELARGIHPTMLTEGGLAAALPELATRSGVPVELRVDAGRAPVPVEVAAYFVCAEALTNVAKYAGAARVTIEARREAGRLVVAIADDGTGGADPRRGSGLRGLSDRVEALGGRLTVESPPGAGTRLVAELPAG
jgi:signal transduction histidine kinase